MSKSALDQLTDQQKVFVVEYAADMDRIRAVKEAGYKGQPNVNAARLLANPRIKAALAEVGTKLDRSMLTVERLADQLAMYVFRDVGEFVDEEGYLKCSLRDLPPHARQCIDSWEVENSYDRETGDLTSQKIKVKLVPKLRSLELAMQWKKMLDPKGVTVNLQQNFDWSRFCEMPSNVVEERMTKALENGNGTKSP